MPDPIDETMHPHRFPSIVKTPGVCGGAARVVHTRIPVWAIEQLRRDEVSDADILAGHPSLTIEDLLQVRWYVQAFKEEIDHEIYLNEAGFDGQVVTR